MANEDIWKAIGTIIIIFVVLSMIGIVFTVLAPTQCTTENNKIAELNLKIDNLNTQITELNKTATFYQVQYLNLTETTVTKKDFTDMQNMINILTIQINDTKSQVINMNQQVTNIQNINTIRYSLSFFITIDLALLSLTVLDILIFKGKYIKKLSNKVYSWRNQTESHIEHHTQINNYQ